MNSLHRSNNVVAARGREHELDMGVFLVVDVGPALGPTSVASAHPKIRRWRSRVALGWRGSHSRRLPTRTGNRRMPTRPVAVPGAKRVK
jgi:hypothetical protein